jgi:Ca2+-binding RTX toxin-like protein
MPAFFFGTAASESITGSNLTDDMIFGDAGNDTLSGLLGLDTLFGDSGNDSLLGGLSNDLLYGGEGNDTLNGESGNDTMVGGTGNDIYFVDSINDSVQEGLNAGIDTVNASIDYTLGANLENLTLLTGAINGTGNTLDNVIIGNTASNSLNGSSGNDTLTDTSVIGVFTGGNDTLNGGTGADSMSGGDGNDTYIVDNAGDIVTDISGFLGGVDTIQSLISWDLNVNTSNVENLTLTGGSNTSGTGNNLANVIIGNIGSNLLRGNGGNDTLDGGGFFGADTLDGGTGTDSMTGGLGNDTYIVDIASDIIVEAAGGGTDTVQSSITFSLAPLANVENLTLTGVANINGTGNGLGNVITGNTGINTLDGQGGNDTLIGGDGDDLLLGGSDSDSLTGGVGNDALTGGSNADFFVFSSKSAFNVANLGVDTITDFSLAGGDLIVLDQTVFGAIALGNIGFVANDAAAASVGSLITYSASTGNLFFNQNGAAAGFGTGGQFATVSGTPSLTIGDFAIIP